MSPLHHEHEISWTLRSLLATGLLAMCVVATALSISESAERAEIERNRQAAIAEEAIVVAELANHLAKATAATRDAFEAPRLKPARSTTTLLAADNVLENLVDFDFTSLTTAKVDAVQRKCLAQAIYYEARSEKRIGQLAVADVVLNRVASRIYPDTICGVVFQGSERRTGCQFSFTCDGSMQARLNQRKWKASEDLAGAILAGVHVPVSRNATHYHANYVDPYWAPKMTPTATIGTHKFYRFRDRRTTEAAPAAM
ncbi:MAG: cell wall hydrolase [Marinicaulis sp.]|nr:cell wall hydrolase [Marinicaulis sp.]